MCRKCTLIRTLLSAEWTQHLWRKSGRDVGNGAMLFFRSLRFINATDTWKDRINGINRAPVHVILVLLVLLAKRPSPIQTTKWRMSVSIDLSSMIIWQMRIKLSHTIEEGTWAIESLEVGCCRSMRMVKLKDKANFHRLSSDEHIRAYSSDVNSCESQSIPVKGLRIIWMSICEPEWKGIMNAPSSKHAWTKQ